MTSPGLRQDPATNGSASLSRHCGCRFGHHLPYRTTQDDLSGGQVAVMHRVAAIAGPTPHGEGQLRADVVADRADACAAREAGVDAPRPPRPASAKEPAIRVRIRPQRLKSSTAKPT